MKCNEPPCRTRIVIYTDQPRLALGASTILTATGTFEVITADCNLAYLVPLSGNVQPRIILVDLTPEVTAGLVSALMCAAPGARIVLWGRSISAEQLTQARELGVAGFLSCRTSNEQFIDSLGRVAEGATLFADEPSPDSGRRVSLTPRESQLVALLAQGLRNKEIASCLGITEGTVRIYLSKLFLKVGARDRLELAVFGLKNSFFGQAHWDGRNAFVTEHDEGRAKPALRSLVLVEPARRSGYRRTVQSRQ